MTFKYHKWYVQEISMTLWQNPTVHVMCMEFVIASAKAVTTESKHRRAALHTR